MVFAKDSYLCDVFSLISTTTEVANCINLPKLRGFIGWSDFSHAGAMNNLQNRQHISVLHPFSARMCLNGY